MINFNGAAALETPEFMIERLDEFGGPDSYNHYAVGWAHAMDTPYQWTKQVASHFGGTRNGTIVHWPAGFEAQGRDPDAVRARHRRRADRARRRRAAEPTFVNGVQQTPMQGVSMRYSFDDAGAAERHETQYFEMFGNRGIYHKGWTAVTRHKTPWLLVGEEAPAFDDDVWELYDTSVDWTQFEDVVGAAARASSHELQRLFLIEATKNNVLPLDDRVAERLIPEIAGRPTLVKGNRQRLFGGMGRLTESSVVSIKNKSHAVTAEIVVPDGGAQGVIIAQGGSIGGWSLYAQGRQAALLLQPARHPALLRRLATARSRPARTRCGWSSPTTAPGSARAAPSTLYLDGEQVGEGSVGATAAMIFSADDTCDVGKEGGALVADDYPVPNDFTGEVNWVEIDVGDAAADADHLLDPDELLRVAMARQ